MSKSTMNLQDSFLNQVRRENAEVKVLLVNGTMLRGSVKGFDNFTLVLNSRNGQHLIYKHAIAQLLSHRPSGPRREGEDHTHGAEGHEQEHGAEETSEGASADSSAVAAAPQQREQRGGGQGQQHRGNREGRENRDNRDNREPREKKGGFNTLDLSKVKIEQGAEAKTEVQS